jgi:predicted DNA-binding transcriptional regulator AlpA
MKQALVKVIRHYYNSIGCDVKNLFNNLEQIIAQSKPTDCASLVGELERLKAIGWAKLLHPQPTTQLAEQGRYLTVQEVTARFGVTDRWLYRHKKKLSHSQPSRKILLFPEKATERWFANRKAN